MVERRQEAQGLGHRIRATHLRRRGAETGRLHRGLPELLADRRRNRPDLRLHVARHQFVQHRPRRNPRALLRQRATEAGGLRRRQLPRRHGGASAGPPTPLGHRGGGVRAGTDHTGSHRLRRRCGEGHRAGRSGRRQIRGGCDGSGDQGLVDFTVGLVQAGVQLVRDVVGRITDRLSPPAMAVAALSAGSRSRPSRDASLRRRDRCRRQEVLRPGRTRSGRRCGGGRNGECRQTFIDQEIGDVPAAEVPLVLRSTRPASTTRRRPKSTTVAKPTTLAESRRRKPLDDPNPSTTSTTVGESTKTAVKPSQIPRRKSPDPNPMRSPVAIFAIPGRSADPARNRRSHRILLPHKHFGGRSICEHRTPLQQQLTSPRHRGGRRTHATAWRSVWWRSSPRRDLTNNRNR